MNPDVVAVLGETGASILLGVSILVFLGGICAITWIERSWGKLYKQEFTTRPDPFPPMTIYLPMPPVKPPKLEPIVMEFPEQDGRGMFVFKGDICT